jgi:hypothetical protein
MFKLTALMFKLTSLAAAATALMPFAVQAAPISWTGGTSAWETGTNWSTGLIPTTTSAVTIGVTTNNPVQINSNVSLSGTGGALTIGPTGGGTESLNINSGFTLTMLTKPITLNGGSLTGPGTVSGTGAIQGYGTFSALDTSSAAWSANSTLGFLTLSGGKTYKGSFATSSSTGLGFNFNGVTLSGISTSGTARTAPIPSTFREQL